MGEEIYSIILSRLGAERSREVYFSYACCDIVKMTS